ncbi:hypothetical protein BSIN_0300 [Burkholderia singularis]|uniref:Uncharacterized protein n=1 Tax=Burkholderia singularis TaxID=1503053 RepID=A0A238H4T0_9BURK|nr:hypothetical protein BSIN_0300 [Burkholderia singularis]
MSWIAAYVSGRSGVELRGFAAHRALSAQAGDTPIWTDEAINGRFAMNGLS